MFAIKGKKAIMFSLLSRFLQSLSKKPKAIMVAVIAISLVCIYPVMNLRWELQLSDMLENQRKSPSEEELKAGRLLPLTLVLESKDTSELLLFASSLEKELKKLPSVRFCSYYIDKDFYEKNQLLFLSPKDLNFIYQRLVEAKEEIQKRQNPFIVQLEENENFINADSLEKKYKAKFRNIFRAEEGTVRLFDIFPNINTSSLDTARFFVSSIKKVVESIQPEGISIQYTGYAQKVIQTGKTLLPEAKKAGVITAFFIAILLLIAFFRQPQLIVPAGLPIALSIYWTLGCSYFLYGRITLFSLLLAIILPGLATQHVTHIFSRYAEERKKGLNSSLSLESAILGIGPVAAASAMATAALFFSLSFVPYKGLQELGTLGAIGALLNWILCSTITPAFLRLTQKKQAFILFGKITPETLTKKTIRFSKRIKIPVILLTLFTLFLLSNGIVPKFHYNFAETEMNAYNQADSVVKQKREFFHDPIIIQFPDEISNEKFVERFSNGKEDGKYKTINNIYIIGNLLPTNQRYKLQQISNIKELLNDPIYNKISGKDSLRIEHLKNHLNVSEVTEDDLPPSFKQFFSLQKGKETYAFVLPAESADDGLFCRRLERDLKELSNDKPLLMEGQALIHAQTLNQILPYIFRSILFAIASIFLILLLYYNKFSYTLFTLFPPIIAFVWILGFINLFEIKLSMYSALAFPLLIGMSLDGSLHFWNHYLSKQTGSAMDIVRRYGLSIAISQLTSFIGVYSLLSSSHLGLQSIGQVSFIGALSIAIANFVIFPILAIMLDDYRLRKTKEKHS